MGVGMITMTTMIMGMSIRRRNRVGETKWGWL